ncbi:MAG: ABC1 kinase family protein [Nitrospirota bacterium]
MHTRLSLNRRIIKIVWLSINILLSYRINSILFYFSNRETQERYKKSLHEKNAIKIRDAALELRGILIKFGQFMSGRVDILPDEYTVILSQLQDSVPPVEFSQVRNRIIEELGNDPLEVFASFKEEPIASASLGQVHEAYLKNGKRVAVKVQYPGIQDVVEVDMRAAKIVTNILRRQFNTIRLDVLYNEFSKIIHEELNYIHEGHNAERFFNNFTDDKKIIVPKVIWEFTTQHLLTLEFVEGIKITKCDLIKDRGIKLKDVANLLVEAYIKQIFKHAFIHGDPHPGNLFVQDGPKLVFVDFGLMQKITPDMQRGIKETIFAIIERDIPSIVKGLLKLGIIARGRNISEYDIEKVVGFFIEKYRDMSPKEFKNITIDDIGEDLGYIFRIYSSLQIPNNFILLGRTLGLLNGLNSILDPDSNIIDLAKPHARRFIEEENGILGRIINKWREIGDPLIKLPGLLEEFILHTYRGELKTEMSSYDVTGVLTKLYKLGFRAVMAIFTIGLIFAYIYLKKNSLAMESITVGVIAIFSAILLISSFIRDL